MSLPKSYKAYFSSASHGGKPELRDIELKHPAKNQVLIKVEFTPINPTDLMTASNNFYTPESEEQLICGTEGSGTIVEVGDMLEKSFKVGQKVRFVGQGWAQYVLLSTKKVFPIPEGVSMEQAANHFINPMTVHHMGAVARREGHKAVLHTAGSSALGRMLIRYFKHIGITLVSLVRKDKYIEDMKKDGADYVLNMSEPDFEKKLKEVVEKEHVTMALDAISGDFTNKIMKALPNGSSIWVYGILSSSKVEIDVLQLFKQKKVEGLYLWNYMKDIKRRGEKDMVLKEVHDLLPTLLSTKVQKSFRLDELEEAKEFRTQNPSKGKVLLMPN